MSNSNLTQSKIDELVQSAKDDVVHQIWHDLDWSMSRCDSPIEKLFAAAMIHPSTCSQFDYRLDLLEPRSGKLEHCQVAPIGHTIFMWQQIGVGPYRVDFLLDVFPNVGLPKLVVECDGHDFHERTKEQAQRDKARDRYLVGQGLRVVRFTGSEIFADPVAAADQAIQILLGVAA